MTTATVPAPSMPCVSCDEATVWIENLREARNDAGAIHRLFERAVGLLPPPLRPGFLEVLDEASDDAVRSMRTAILLACSSIMGAASTLPQGAVVNGLQAALTIATCHAYHFDRPGDVAGEAAVGVERATPKG